MTLVEVMSGLAAKGSDQIKKIYLRHGAKEPFFGVKIADLKVIQKRIKGDQALAMELYATGNGDAQHLAGMVADGRKMTRAQLQKWAATAAWGMISDYTVAWVASEHPDGIGIALEWIDSGKEPLATSGWNTLSALAATVPDDNLPVKQFGALLDRIAKTLKSSPDCTRYAMNGFVISCGTYIAPLADKAMATAKKLGKVEVDMGDTSCNVPEAESYIIKCRRGAPVAAKRKTVRC